MDFFRWRRTFVRALGPALLCGLLAAWGVYALTADGRPTYRSQGLLSTGVMTGHTAGAAYVRDLVLNELENIMNLARSFETREELATRLLATFLALDGPSPHVISARAYADFRAELDPAIVARHGPRSHPDSIYASLVHERDSLRRYGEATAYHPLIQLLYGDNPLVGAEQLATLRVNRKGLSDILEISYSTVDAAWCKLTLDRHIDVFLDAHRAVGESRSNGALSYFRAATAESRAALEAAEERLRLFATRNKIINYYEQTRYIASLKNQVDHRYTEEMMAKAAADSNLIAVEARLAKRMDLVRLNNLVDDRRRELGQLSRERVRLEIMTADSTGTDGGALAELDGRMEAIKREMSEDLGSLQGVYSGPEGLELGSLLTEWLSASIRAEEAKGRLEVLDLRRIDFRQVYTSMADLGATIKKIEREVKIAEEDYLENLRNLNEALQKEHSERSVSDLRLVDEPILPTKPEKSKRLIFVAAALLAGGLFPLVLAVALELLSSALLSFAEAERRSGLSVVGGVGRWSWLRRTLHAKRAPALRATTADLLWQGLRSRTESARAATPGAGPRLVVLASLRPGAGKTYVADLWSERLAARGLRVCIVSDQAAAPPRAGVNRVLVDGIAAMHPGADPRAVAGLSPSQWSGYDVIFWELPALVTGRLPVDVARAASDALLVHPAGAGWTDAHAGATAQLRDALGREPYLIVNGLPVDVLLNQWGTTWRQLLAWRSTKSTPVPGSTREADRASAADSVPAASLASAEPIGGAIPTAAPDSGVPTETAPRPESTAGAEPTAGDEPAAPAERTHAPPPPPSLVPASWEDHLLN